MSNPYEAPSSDLSRAGAESQAPGSAAAKLPWYDQVWLALPFALVVVGGAIGGACGGAAWAINQKIFRATKHRGLRYVWTGLVSIAAVFAYLGLALAFLSLIKGEG